jgi:hypothetical protein
MTDSLNGKWLSPVKTQRDDAQKWLVSTLSCQGVCRVKHVFAGAKSFVQKSGGVFSGDAGSRPLLFESACFFVIQSDRAGLDIDAFEARSGISVTLF